MGNLAVERRYAPGEGGKARLYLAAWHGNADTDGSLEARATIISSPTQADGDGAEAMKKLCPLKQGCCLLKDTMTDEVASCRTQVAAMVISSDN